MNFYDRYARLCNSHDLSPCGAALKMGISKSSVTRWSDGTKPNRATLVKISDFFNVPVSYFDEDEKTPVPINEGGQVDGDSELSEMMEYLEMLRDRKECRMLFSLAKSATREDVELAVAIIEKRREQGSRE